MHLDGNPCLVKEDRKSRKIEVLFENSCLCARGQIAVLSPFEPNKPFEPPVS